MCVSNRSDEQIFPASVVRLCDEKILELADVDASQRLSCRRSYFQSLSLEPHLKRKVLFKINIPTFEHIFYLEKILKLFNKIKKIASNGCNAFSRPSKAWENNCFHWQKDLSCHNVILQRPYVNVSGVFQVDYFGG